MSTDHTKHAHADKCCASPSGNGHHHPHDEAHDHDHDHDHDHNHGEGDSLKVYLPGLTSLVLLLGGLVLDYYFKSTYFNGPLRLSWYLAAYLPVAYPVIREAIGAMRKGSFFNEFTLMVLATFGAFAISEFPEGVAVMLFYAIGELFQGAAVKKSRNNIKALMDVRPTTANVWTNGAYRQIDPNLVNIGDQIQIKAGEKVPLDGYMLSEKGSFNTAALTGESKPGTIYKDEPVLAGMLNLEQVVELKVSKRFEDSALAKILDMVQNAAARKAKTELLIRRFAKVYTPAVFFLALALVILPYFLVPDYLFRDWLYRGLIFLVISCPCALVISIPLGYFGGIGAASRHGILFKGSNFLDLMTKVNTVVMDKTGTLTKGVFEVQEVGLASETFPELTQADFLNQLAALESKSTHPIAKAITRFSGVDLQIYTATDIKEIAGYGLEGTVRKNSGDGQRDLRILAGSTRLLKQNQIAYEPRLDERVESIVAVAIGGRYAGFVLLADELKPNVAETIQSLKKLGISQTAVLSGDKQSIVEQTASSVGIPLAFGDLLPDQKVRKLEALKKDANSVIAFMGDGINDAPVLAISDVGIAMGAMGSDAAIETADVVIQTDEPAKVVTAIKIARATKQIVIQNITLAFVVKALVLVLGAGGVATMWEAVFADVGVALLAILNAVRIQNMKFES